MLFYITVVVDFTHSSRYCLAKFNFHCWLYFLFNLRDLWLSLFRQSTRPGADQNPFFFIRQLMLLFLFSKNVLTVVLLLLHANWRDIQGIVFKPPKLLFFRCIKKLNNDDKRDCLCHRSGTSFSLVPSPIITLSLYFSISRKRATVNPALAFLEPFREFPVLWFHCITMTSIAARF